MLGEDRDLPILFLYCSVPILFSLMPLVEEIISE